MPTSTCYWSAAHPRPARDPHLAALPVDVSSHKSRPDLLLVSSQPNPHSQSLADPNQSRIPAARSPISCSDYLQPGFKPDLEAHAGLPLQPLVLQEVVDNESLTVHESAQNSALSEALRGFFSETANEYAI